MCACKRARAFACSMSILERNVSLLPHQTQRYKDAERARQRLEVAEAEWRKDLKVVVSQRDMLVKDEEEARKETEEVKEEEERKRKRLTEEARREMEEEERKRKKLTEENRAKLTRIRRLAFNLSGEAKYEEERGVEEKVVVVEEEEEDAERIVEALEQAKTLLAECKSDLMVSRTDIQLHDLRQEIEDMREREIKSGEILERALQEKDEIMKRWEKLREERKDQTGEEELKKKIDILEVSMGKSQKSHDEEKRMLRQVVAEWAFSLSRLFISNTIASILRYSPFASKTIPNISLRLFV